MLVVHYDGIAAYKLTAHVTHMSKNRKSRRKSRNRKSVTNADTTQERVDDVLVGISSVSAALLLPSQNDSNIVNIQKPNVDNVKKSSNDTSKQKRKNSHTLTATNDSSLHNSNSLIKRSANKRRRKTDETLQNQNEIEDETVKKEGEFDTYSHCSID